jgi:hypothetical protein
LAGTFRNPKSSQIDYARDSSGARLMLTAIFSSEAGTKVIGNSPASAFLQSRETLNSSECLTIPGENMDRKIQGSSPESPKVSKVEYEQNCEVWEPPFDRWLKLTDDLLRDWPHSATNYHEQRL